LVLIKNVSFATALVKSSLPKTNKENKWKCG
jgi:hypothetical protein